MQYTNISEIKKSDLQEIATFLNSASNSKDFSYEYLDWLYFKNPCGPVLGFNAFHEEKIIGHYAVIPLLSSINGQEDKILLSLNTAIDKSHRNKKIFTDLANKTFSLAIDEGYDHVIGVANSKSITGFVKYLGFKVLHRLDAFISFTAPQFDERDSFILWNKELSKWRLSSPKTKFFSNNTHIFSSYRIIFNALHSKLNFNNFVKEKTAMPPYLIIGSKKAFTFNNFFYFTIPNFLKPSPLVLINKKLNNNSYEVDSLLITTIDFDIF